MRFEKLLWLAIAWMMMGAAQAQLAANDPDWIEQAAPKPPSFDIARLIPIEMPSYVTLRFGVDPATITIGQDGIVRYVMVAINATGSLNAMFEGIHCSRGEVKTYARYSASGQWHNVVEPSWRGLAENAPSRHALALARQGVCNGRTASADSVADMVQALKSVSHAAY